MQFDSQFENLSRLRHLAFATILVVATCSQVIPTAVDGQEKTERPARLDKQRAEVLKNAESELTDLTEPTDLTELHEQDESAKSPRRIYKYKKLSNIIYAKGEDYTLLCDVYLPAGTGPFPAVLAIHGGAWRHGSKLKMLRHAWELAKSGYVVVAINYRHAPQYKFPAQIHDCKRAVRWIRAKCQKLKVNPDQIAVFGYSAGGHLSALLGATDENDQLEGILKNEDSKISSRVQCVVVGGGPCEFDWIKSNVLVDWLGDSPMENPEIYKRAAPLTYVTNDDPPFIFFHGGNDKVVPPSSSLKMHDKLQQGGIESHYRTIDGKGHFATFTDTSWMEDAIAFMDRKLKRTHHE